VTLSMEVATQVTMKAVTTPLMVMPSLASESKPPPLSGTLTGTLLWSGTSVMGLTKLSALWKGSDDSSNGLMTLQASIDSQTSMMYDLFGHFRIIPDS
jgi:hypothetical protein